MGVSKLVCSHLQLRHLILLSRTEEPEVYLLSTAILEAENTLLDQSDRSTQIVLSTGPTAYRKLDLYWGRLSALF